MEINKINQSPNFGARIVIQKTGFKNLGADLVNTLELGSKTTEIGSSAITETTILPSDAVAFDHFPFAKKILKFAKDEFGKLFDKISQRNIKTSAIEGVDAKEVASNSAVATSGAGSLSTGVESYDLSIASALDQSINYPNSSYPASVPEFIERHFPQSIVEHSAAKEHSVYNQLWDPRNSAGNELASTQSSIWSTIGAVSQGAGFEMITKGKKAFQNAEDIQRKLPS
jgi:hypothetical protein